MSADSIAGPPFKTDTVQFSINGKILRNPMKRHIYFCALAVLLAVPVALHADEAASPEARLKEALKNSMLQLRTVSGQLSDAQAQVSDLQSQNADVT